MQRKIREPRRFEHVGSVAGVMKAGKMKETERRSIGLRVSGGGRVA